MLVVWKTTAWNTYCGYRAGLRKEFILGILNSHIHLREYEWDRFGYSIPSTENNPIRFAPYRVNRKVLDDLRKKMGETLKEW